MSGDYMGESEGVRRAGCLMALGALFLTVAVPGILYLSQFIPGRGVDRAKEACAELNNAGIALTWNPDMVDAYFEDRDKDGFQDVIIRYKTGYEGVYETHGYPNLKKMRQRDTLRDGQRPAKEDVLPGSTQ